MAYEIGEADGHIDLQDAFVQFACGWNKEGSVVFTGTGDGTLTRLRACGPNTTTPAETWTLVCTTAGGDGVAVFSVTGSTSGAQASATAGTAYDNGIIKFLIAGDPGYTFVLSDQFQFTYATGPMGSDAWELIRDTDPGESDKKYILRGDGAGSDNIYIGFHTESDTPTDAHSILLMGMLNYNAANMLYEQPGAIPVAGYAGHSVGDPPRLTLDDVGRTIKYWFVGNARRFVIGASFGGLSSTAYMGWLLPLSTPAQYTYPMFIGGSARRNKTHSTTGNEFANFWQTDYGSAVSGMTWIVMPNGEWKVLNNSSITMGYVFPYNYGSYEGMATIDQNIDESYPIFRMKAISEDTGAQTSDEGFFLGELEGCYAIPGRNNQLENTFQISSIDYVVFQNAYRTADGNYMALKLE